MTPITPEPDRRSVEAYRQWLAEADDDALLREEINSLLSNPTLHAGIAAGLATEFGSAPVSTSGRLAARVNRLNARLGSLLEEIARGLRPAQLSRSLAILGPPAGTDDEDQAVLDIIEPADETGLVPLPSTVVDLLGRRATATLEHGADHARLVVTGVRPGFSGLLMVGVNHEDGEDDIVVAERSRPDQFVAVLPWFEPGLPPRLALLATAN